MTDQGFAWTPKDIKGLYLNYIDEQSAQWIYSALAEMDEQGDKAVFLQKMADLEQKHADAWRDVIERLGFPVPAPRHLPEHRLLAGLARLFGVRAAIPFLHRTEVDGISKYKRQQASWKDPVVQEALEVLMPAEVAEEIDLFDQMSGSSDSGGTLRSVILGVNDGLVSVLAIAAGVAGATSSNIAIIIAGLAGLVAGAVSMAASNYVSVKAEQEVNSSRERLQREAVEIAPEKKKEQLKGTYVAEGLTEQEADNVVERIAERPDGLLKAVMAEQGGVPEATLTKPARHAVYTGVAFALAGAVPLVPFLFLQTLHGILAAVILTCTALFFAGVIRSLSTLRPFVRSGIEMLLIGMSAAAATYLVGLAVGGVVG